MLIVLLCIQSISIFGMEPRGGSGQTNKLSLPYFLFGLAIPIFVFHQIVWPLRDGDGHTSFFLESLQRLRQYCKNNGRSPIDSPEAPQSAAAEQPVQPPAQQFAAPVGQGEGYKPFYPPISPDALSPEQREKAQPSAEQPVRRYVDYVPGPGLEPSLYPPISPDPLSPAQWDAQPEQFGQVYLPFAVGDQPYIQENNVMLGAAQEEAQQRPPYNLVVGLPVARSLARMAQVLEYGPGYSDHKGQAELDEWGRPIADRDAQLAFAEQDKLNRQVVEELDQEDRDLQAAKRLVQEESDQQAAERLSREWNGGGARHGSGGFRGEPVFDGRGTMVGRNNESNLGRRK